MPRKKVSTSETTPTGVDLDEGEELVIENTRRVRRERRPKAADDAGVIDAVPVLADDADDPDDDPHAYSDTSLAALVYNEGDEDQTAEKYCTVLVRRHPDNMGDRFVKPCTSKTHLSPLRNVGLDAERMDIEDRVRTEQGSGGHYFFQIHLDGRLVASWQSTLSDPSVTPEPKAASEFQPPSVASPPVDPMAAFISSLKQTAELKTLLFGDTEAHYKEQLARVEAELAEARRASQSEPQSEKLALLAMALNEKTKPAVSERVVEAIFPSDEPEKKSWIAEVVSIAIENKDAIAGVLGGLLGGLQPPAATSQQNVANLLRGPAPAAALPTSDRPVFGRHKAKPAAKPEPPPDASTSDAIDAEDVTAEDANAGAEDAAK